MSAIGADIPTLLEPEQAKSMSKTQVLNFTFHLEVWPFLAHCEYDLFWALSTIFYHAVLNGKTMSHQVLSALLNGLYPLIPCLR